MKVTLGNISAKTLSSAVNTGDMSLVALRSRPTVF